ncbi:tail fiber domain-containing protein [Streptococcus oralis]|nr:tail fiber domain-containing protein [Streptococcus mitis]
MDIFRRKKFDEAMFAKNRTLAIRVGQYQSSDIKEASFDYGYIKGDTYKPGGTCAGSAKIVFTSIITTFNKLDKIYPEIGLLVDGAYEWVKMGEYFINDIEIDRNRKTTKLDLMDGMFKLNREHVTDLTYPAEIRHVIKEICLKTGVKLANENMDIASMNYRIESIPKEKKMTFRDVLSLASQMLGMSCFFNREGKLEIKELTDSGITITADSYFMHGLTKSEVEYQIAGITCKKDKETLTVGMRTGRSLELDNLFMSQAILDNLYHKIKDIRYYPFNLNYQGHLLLNVGEWVTIKTNTGETFKSPVLSQSFTFKGGLRGRISADSKAGNDAQYSYAGTITKKIVQFNEFEAQIQNQIEEADKGFDQKVAKIKKDFSDQVELAKARAEEVKRELSDTIDQRFSSFNNGSLQEIKRRIEEALQNAGASISLAHEAKRIGLDSVARLEEFKAQATSVQTALSGDLDALKRTVTSEVNQASEYRRTTTEALSRMTGQMDGFATKSEVKQGIDGLTQTFAKMKVGGRNYAEDYDFSRGLWRYSQGDGSPVDWKIINGEYHVKGTTKTWKQMQIHSKEGSQASGKSSTALLVLEIGETYTLSFQAMCYSGSPNVWVSLRANRTAPGNPEIINGNFNLTSSWQTYQVTIPALTKPDNFDFWRIILGYSEIGHVAFRKVELTRSSTRIDAGPAPEDGKTDLVVAKSEFEKTAEGLFSKLATVETYVSQDGQRQETLQRYTREESAKQATAVRELVNRDFVGKASYQEDVRGIERKFEAITNPQNGSIATQIATYKTAVDGRFADIISQIAGKANQTDFQRVRETSQLYERILGNTDNGIANNVARMALTNQLFQVEVSKAAKGGRNYIRGIKEMRVGSGSWDSGTFRGSGSGSVRTIEVSDGPVSGFNKAVRIISSDPKGQIGVAQDGFEIMPGTYTMSVWVKGNAGQRVRLQSYWWSDDSTGISPEFILKDDKWTYLTFSSERKKAGKLSIGYVYLVNGAKGSYIDVLAPQLEEGSVAMSTRPAIEDTDEAIRTVQSQLAGSFAFQNLTSAGAIISQINATNNQILIEAEKIRLKGKTLLDELTAIQGYFKRLFVGEGAFATLNTDILRANSITADKLVMDMAMARMFVSSDIFTDTLAAKEAFINKLRSVVVTATLLEGYKGRIGGFQIGTHEKDSSVYWITGQNQFSVGMSNGSGHWSQTALWVNWGNNWGYPGDYAWFVKHTGQMYCYNRAEFWNTPIIHGDLKVTGHIFYNNENSGKSGYWIHSSKYSNFEPSNNYLYLYYSGSGYDWIPMNKEISDRRYKHNIEDSTVSGLDVVENLKTYSYRKKYDGKIEDIACGIMAQDVQKYAPEAFFENPDGAYSYNTFALVPYLIKAIQELNQKIEKLEKT